MLCWVSCFFFPIQLFETIFACSFCMVIAEKFILAAGTASAVGQSCSSSSWSYYSFLPYPQVLGTKELTEFCYSKVRVTTIKELVELLLNFGRHHLSTDRQTDVSCELMHVNVYLVH